MSRAIASVAFVDLAACAPAPARVDASTVEAPPSSDGATVSAAPARGPSFVGDPLERAAARRALDGVWAYEGEVWQIDGGHARVWRPRATDIVIEREIEMLAPCMFVAREGHTLLGPYVIDHGERTDWTRGGVAVFRSGDPYDLTICHAPEVYRLEGNTCEVRRFDRDSQTLESVDAACNWGPAEPPNQWFVGLVGPDGEQLGEVRVPVREITAGPAGLALAVPNLASACGSFGADEPGCTAAQAQLLRDEYWANHTGQCAGAELRLDLDPWFENAVVLGPEECPVATLPGESAYVVEPGVVLADTRLVIRPGATTSLAFVFENPTAQSKFVRLPSEFWRFVLTVDGQPLEVGGCDPYGRRYHPLPTNAAEFRLDAGGKLTVYTPWRAIAPVRRGDTCKIRPLRAKPHELTLELIEGDPNARLRVHVEVKGKPICDPCSDPWLD